MFFFSKKENFYISIFLAILLLPIAASARVVPKGFFDSEKSGESIISAGTLDFSLSSSGDFSGGVSETKSAKQNIEVKDMGTVGFQYQVKADNFSGDLCNYLRLEVRFEGRSALHEDNLKSFSYKIGLFSSPEKLEFEAKLAGSGAGLEGEKCNFNLVFEGWQDNLVNFGDGGFWDEERIVNEVKSEELDTENLVINEVYYDDPSNDDTGKEWIEIYNGTDSPIDLSGYELNAASGDYFVFPSGFSIDSKKFVIVHWNAMGTNTSTDLFTGSPTNFDNMGNTSGWAALFKSSSHNKDNIVDYIEYGAGDRTWENEAVQAGIWTEDDFVPDVTEGHSLSRKNAGQDYNLSSDFEELTTPTPGN